MRLSIQKFQELYAFSEMEMDDTDRAIKLVQIVTGKSQAEVEAMPLLKFNQLCSEITQTLDLSNGKPSTQIWVGRNLYRIHLNITSMSAGRYAEVATYSKHTIPNLHKIMASIVQPMTWYGKLLPYDAKKHEQYADDMLNADFHTAYHSAVFFYALFSRSMKSLHPYLKAEAMRKGASEQLVDQTLNDSQRILDGFILPKWLQKWSVSS